MANPAQTIPRTRAEKLLGVPENENWTVFNSKYTNTVCVLHTVCSQYFPSLSSSVISVTDYITCFQIILQCSALTILIWQKTKKNQFLLKLFFHFFSLKVLIASYGGRARESVFQMKFRVLYSLRPLQDLPSF